MLTIFDVEGAELSRQPKCILDALSGYDERGSVCPITGEDMTFEKRPNGQQDIIVDDWSGKRRYRLVERNYVLHETR